MLGVVRVGLISDEMWVLVEPLMPSNGGRRGRPFVVDHRLLLEGIAWRYRAGVPWRDVPVLFGPWQTLWKRHQRFSVDGTYQRMLQVVCEAFEVRVEDLDGRDGVEDPGDVAVTMLLSADSTVVRAHQHAAGAPRNAGVAMAGCAPRAGG